ncbi:MAG: Rrf2 family transcriptional regulator [Myxococcota bacterium]
MNADTRLSLALHALLHMAARFAPVTSAELGRCMRANPVLVRRTMAGLRERGLVRSEKGRGGGWSIGRDPAAITIGDVQAALGRPPLLAVGLRSRLPECLVEQAVNGALEGAVAEAEALLADRLRTVTLATLAEDLRYRSAARGPHDHAHRARE